MTGIQQVQHSEVAALGKAPLTSAKQRADVFNGFHRDLRTSTAFEAAGSFIQPKQGVFLTQTKCPVCLKLKLCDRRRAPPLFKVNYCKIYTYYGLPAPRCEMLHRDRCVRCKLIGPNHCEAYGGGGGDQSLATQKHIIPHLAVILRFMFSIESLFINVNVLLISSLLL